MADPFDRLTRQIVDALTAHLAEGKPLRIPEAGRLLFEMFTDLHASRSYSASGPNPIGFAEIEAYARLYRWPLKAHHVRALRRIDDAWLKHARATSGGASDKPAPAMTADLFDAVFVS